MLRRKSGAFIALIGFWIRLATGSTPVPTYGTYFGADSVAAAIAMDSSGNLIIAGSTSSQTLPGTASAFQPTKAVGFPGNANVFVAKFNPAGTALLWATFLGGDAQDNPTSLVVDAAGSIYVVGSTTSSTFPTTPGAYLGSNSAGGSLGFAAKISGDGRSLLYSTYLPVGPAGLAVSSAGEALIITGASLERLNPTGTSLASGLTFAQWQSLIGPPGPQANAIAVDGQGNIYIAGVTGQANSVTTTANAYQGQYASPATRNGYLVELNPAATQVLYGTYLGPQYSDTEISRLTVAPDGSLYLTGITNATSFQATPGSYRTTPAAGFVARLTLGSSFLSLFSYLDCDPSFPPLIQIGNQPATIYLTYATSTGQYGVGVGFSVTELNISTLALTSSFISPSEALAPSGSALAGPHSLWLVGGIGQQGSSCPTCSMGNLITATAFQATLAGSDSAVLLQLTDESLTVGSVVSAASFLSGPVSPGEIVTITGTAIGPITPATLTLDQTGKVSTSLGAVQVLFNGTPAPLTYVSASQINAVVPYEIQGLLNPYVQVSYQGQSSSAFALAAAATNPAIFTANGSGSGPAAALNQDGTYNSPSSPAPKGSYVVLYLTGEGQTAPTGVTGKITTVSSAPPLTPQPLLAVAVLINGQPANVAFWGEAPSLVSGVMQINVQIPPNASSGDLPLQVSVGGNSSQNGVTISVQ